MGTSLNKKSVDPSVDYEKFTEDVGRAAYLKLRAHEQREKVTGHKEDKPKINKERKKDRVKVSEHRAKDKEVDDDDTSDSESGK
ncbi:hypothetical protein E4U49_003403 [Claviceps purpurea]|nr:hypothetical protein E4U49_003403 [Claviceps purpurea]